MNKKIITGLRKVYENYDAFFIDLWGVMHNGKHLYPGAIEVVKNLYKLKKRFVLMSNAPRPSENVEKFLLNMKMDKIFAKNIITSGEAATKSLQQEVYGKNFCSSLS
jgi:ribonucleotide monophosphatase NagD (HAD superfamily)